MLCGSGGSGKSTFINTLCQQQVLSTADMMKSIPIPTHAHNDPGLSIVPITVGEFFCTCYTLLFYLVLSFIFFSHPLFFFFFFNSN